MKTEVWIVESEENRAAADALWTVAQEWPHISVTIFHGPEVPTAETWCVVLDQVQMHHRAAVKGTPFDTIDVIGSEATPEARRTLSAVGFERISLTREGFRASREKPS